MKMYYANNGNLKIEEREVVRQTTSSIFIERTMYGQTTERREAKRSEWGAWFVTHEEAKNHLINRVNNEIVRHTILLESANKEMVKVNLL
jgi:hypothetical protein